MRMSVIRPGADSTAHRVLGQGVIAAFEPTGCAGPVMSNDGGGIVKVGPYRRSLGGFGSFVSSSFGRFQGFNIRAAYINGPARTVIFSLNR